jgi:anti-sigma-K factor RskA
MSADSPEDEEMQRDDPMIAAEYSLGLLEGEELLAARGKAAIDPDFAWRKEWWDNWFVPLSDEVAGAEPASDLWQKIDAQVDAMANAGDDRVVALEQRVRRWQWTAGLTSVAAAIALAFVALPGGGDPSPGPAPTMAAALPLVATIPIGDTQLRLNVTYMPSDEQMLVTAYGLEPDGVHDHELWLVPADGSALQSLGVVVPGEARAMELPADIVRNLDNGVELLLTREPLGGKPADQDAGPVVAQGAFSQA